MGVGCIDGSEVHEGGGEAGQNHRPRRLRLVDETQRHPTTQEKGEGRPQGRDEEDEARERPFAGQPDPRPCFRAERPHPGREPKDRRPKKGRTEIEGVGRPAATTVPIHPEGVTAQGVVVGKVDVAVEGEGTGDEPAVEGVRARGQSIAWRHAVQEQKGDGDAEAGPSDRPQPGELHEGVRGRPDDASSLVGARWVRCPGQTRWPKHRGRPGAGRR